MSETWVLVDTETDGLTAPIRAVEIAAQRFEGLVPAGEPFRVFLNHGIPIPGDAFSVHGYDQAFLEDNGIDPRRAYDEFWRYVNGARVSAHFAQYDWKQVLLPESARIGVKVAGEFGFCTWKLAKRALPSHLTWNLDYLREHYGLRCSRAHSAIGDVEAVSDLISRVVQPALVPHGFRAPSQLAAFSNLPLKICRLITAGQAFQDPDDAIEFAWAESVSREKTLREFESQRQKLINEIEHCDENDLQRMAVELGFYGDEEVIEFKGRSFRFTGTLIASKRKEAEAAVLVRGAIASKKWPPDYLVLGGAAPGGGSLRSALIGRQVGAEKPVLVAEEDFFAALSESPVLNADGSINSESSRLTFTPHKPTVRTSRYLSGKISWRASRSKMTG